MTKPRRPHAGRISVRGTPSRRLDGGFTLTELVVTIAIAGVLAALAVPSFNGVIAAGHAKAAASELYTSLFAARSEAIRLNQQVTIAQDAGGWKSGWTTSAGGTTVDSHGALQGADLQEGSGFTAVTYYPSGRLAPGTAAAPTFVVTATTGRSTSTQCVSIAPTGTPYMQAGSTC